MSPQRYLSALALQTYTQCPLRFRYRYVDGLYWSRLLSVAPEDRRAIDKGQAFHLMARRLYEGLDPAAVADPVEQRELEHWLGLLQQFLPRTLDRVYYPELELRLNRPPLHLQAKYDLVVVEADGSATILDWKTERRPSNRANLLKRPQTLVYRYMLCAAGGAYSPLGTFRPEQVSMIYWNPLFPHRWERLAYTAEQYELDGQYLNTLATHLETQTEFAATPDASVCRTCEYRVLCHGSAAEADESLSDEEPPPPTDADWDPSLDLL